MHLQQIEEKTKKTQMSFIHIDFLSIYSYISNSQMVLGKLEYISSNQQTEIRFADGNLD